MFDNGDRRGLGRVETYLTRVGLIAGTLGCLLGSSALTAQVSVSTNALVATMLAHEDYEAAHRGHYMYLSKEWSDRTGGHLWTEKVVETTPGKVRMSSRMTKFSGTPVLNLLLLSEGGFNKTSQTGHNSWS